MAWMSMIWGKPRYEKELVGDVLILSLKKYSLPNWPSSFSFFFNLFSKWVNRQAHCSHGRAAATPAVPWLAPPQVSGARRPRRDGFHVTFETKNSGKSLALIRIVLFFLYFLLILNSLKHLWSLLLFLWAYPFGVPYLSAAEVMLAPSPAGMESLQHQIEGKATPKPPGAARPKLLPPVKGRWPFKYESSNYWLS